MSAAAQTAQPGYRLEFAVSCLTILALASVYVLPSQSASSFFTYFLFIGVVAGLSHRGWRTSGDSLWLLIGALVLYLLMSALWSEHPSLRSSFSISVRILLLTAFVLAVSKCAADVPDFLNWLTMGIAAAACAGAVASLGDFFLHPTWDQRLRGLGQLDNNVMSALVFGAAVIMSMHLTVLSRGDARLAMIAVTVVLLTTVGLTGSRSGYLAVAVGTVALAAAQPDHRLLKWYGIGGGVAGVLGVLAAIAMAPELTIHILPRGTSLRPEIWAAQIEALVADGPIFGRGLLTDDSVTVAGQLYQHPHSLFLSVLVQGGAFGLVLFIAMMVVAGARLWRARWQPAGRLGFALLAGGIAGQLFDGHELIDKVGLSWFYVWLPAGLALAVRRRGAPVP
jgi:O-antigen ligase